MALEQNVNTALLMLMASSAEGIGVLRSFGGLKKVGGESAGIQADLYLTWPIRSASEAGELEKTISGARAAFDDRDSRDDDDPAKWDHVSCRKFKDDSRHLTLALAQEGADGGGRVLISDQQSQVIQATFKTSRKAASYEIKIRVFGLSAGQIGELANGLQEHCTVSLEADQPGLFDGNNVHSLEEHRAKLLPKVGQIVAGLSVDPDDADAPGEEFTGIVVKVYTEEGESLLDLQDAAGEITTGWAASEVVSTLNVIPPKGKEMGEMLDSYRQKAEKKGVVPTIGALISALGEMYTADLTATESWVLSAKVIDLAVKNLKEAKSAPAPTPTRGAGDAALPN